MSSMTRPAHSRTASSSVGGLFRHRRRSSACGRSDTGVPRRDAATLLTARIDAERIAQLEAEQGHDVAAFVAGVQETVGDAGRYLHLGLTSSDVVDTALATQLRDAARIIDADCGVLEDALVEQAERHRLTVDRKSVV